MASRYTPRPRLCVTRTAAKAVPRREFRGSVVIVQRSSVCPSAPRRVLAATLSLALAIPAATVSQAAVAGPARKDKTEGNREQALGEAKQLYEQGRAKFETFDYEGAVDLWTQAYAKLPEDAAGVRNAMVYNIATAQEKAYEVDKDVQHLRQAGLLLQTYVANYKAIFKKTPETKAEVQKAEERIAAINERIAAAERGEAPVAPPRTDLANADAALGPVDGIVWNSGHNPPPDPALVDKNKRLAAEGKKVDAMLISGYVVGSVGLVVLLGSASAFGAGAARDNSEMDNDAGTNSRIAGFVLLGVGLAFVGTAGALIGVGFSRRAKLRRGELAVAPMLTPRGGGAALRFKF